MAESTDDNGDPTTDFTSVSPAVICIEGLMEDCIYDELDTVPIDFDGEIGIGTLTLN